MKAPFKNTVASPPWTTIQCSMARAVSSVPSCWIARILLWVFLLYGSGFGVASGFSGCAIILLFWNWLVDQCELFVGQRVEDSVSHLHNPGTRSNDASRCSGQQTNVCKSLVVPAFFRSH